MCARVCEQQVHSPVASLRKPIFTWVLSALLANCTPALSKYFSSVTLCAPFRGLKLHAVRRAKNDIDLFLSAFSQLMEQTLHNFKALKNSKFCIDNGSLILINPQITLCNLCLDLTTRGFTLQHVSEVPAWKKQAHLL